MSGQNIKEGPRQSKHKYKTQWDAVCHLVKFGPAITPRI